MIIGTKAEFEQLADFILRDYLGNTYDGYDPLDIQAFAKDYLKLDISYFAFDPDTGIEGMRTGNQIILDDRLLDDKKAGERNFTIAHECGHDLINWQDPSYSPQTVVNYRIKSSGKSLVTEDDFKEWQANVVASCLLLRPNLVGWSMFTFMRKDKVTVFDEHYPAVVKTYLETENYDSVRAVQADISDSYIADMTKYATPNETIRSIAIFNTLPSQLAKENTKFQYAVIKSNARAKDYELSLQWLKAAGVVLENIKVTEGKLPLTVYEQLDSFKIYYSDVGLLCFKSGTFPQDVLVNSSISDRARGLLAENYVAEQLTAGGYRLNYWESDGKAELDFIIRQNDSVVPVEVKSADNVRARSLKIFVDKYAPAYSIRLSTKNFGFENGIQSVPLYAIFCL